MTDAALAQPGAGLSSQSLFMIRAEVALREFRRWMGIRRLQDADHAMHCLLTESFGELAPRPFRLLMPRGQARGVLYGYARVEDNDLRGAAAAYADPEQVRILATDRIASKPMPAVWRSGRQLGFEVRIRPTGRRSRNADFRPGKECDAFLWEAIKHPEMPAGMPKAKCRIDVNRFTPIGSPANSSAAAAPNWTTPRQGWRPSSVPGPCASDTPATVRDRMP